MKFEIDEKTGMINHIRPPHDPNSTHAVVTTMSDKLEKILQAVKKTQEKIFKEMF